MSQYETKEVPRTSPEREPQEELPPVAQFLSGRLQVEVDKLLDTSRKLAQLERKLAEARGEKPKKGEEARLPEVEDTYSSLNAEVLRRLELLNQRVKTLQQEWTSSPRPIE